MWTMISRSVRPRVASRMASIRATKAPRLLPPLPATRADALAEAAAAGPGRVLQLLERARADAARREVDDPQEAGVVVRVLDQAQVRERVLDLGALEEAQAAVHLVRHVPALKSALSITRLCALLR